MAEENDIQKPNREAVDPASVGSALGRWQGSPVDFLKWWDSKDHTFGGDATPLSVAGMAWGAAHQKYNPPPVNGDTSLLWHSRMTTTNHRIPENMNEETKHGTTESEAVDQQQACSAFWTPATTKPEGWERKVLCWVVWPECGWPQPPEPVIGWWKHGPGCFAVESVEHANHLVTHWAEIPEPNDQRQATASTQL